MNKRETFYFTDEELEIIRILGLTRKYIKAALHVLLINKRREWERENKELIEIAQYKWLED